MAKTNSKKTEDEELLELGRKMQQFYEMGYVSKKQALKYSFLKGIATGLGVFIGGTLVIGVVLWVLGLFDQVPFIEKLVHTIQQNM